MSARGTTMSKSSSGTKPGREGTTQATHRTSKSRADKSRGITVALVPPVTVEMVPGRFTDGDWLSLVNSEESEDMVLEVLDTLMSRVMDKCFALYLAQQAVPYTVSQARDAMIQIIQWTFVPRDEGEENLETDVSWREQEEALPCPNDSWAQGCVPVSQSLPNIHTTDTQAEVISPGPHTWEEQVTLEPPVFKIPVETSTESPVPGPTQSTCIHTLQLPPCENLTQEKTQDDNKTTKEISLTRKPKALHQPSPPPPEQKKVRRPYRPHRGPLHSASFKDITKSLEETEKEMFLKQLHGMKPENMKDKGGLLPPALYNILKIQLGRPPQKKDVLYDEAGNVLSMPKLDPTRLPQHHVCPQVTVLIPSSEADYRVRKSLNVSGETAGKHLRRGRDTTDKEKQTPKKAVEVMSISDQLCGQLSNDYIRTRPEGPRSSFPLSDGILLDTMQLSHGVILREGNSTQKGSLHSLKLREQGQTEEARALRPIQSSVTQPSVSVHQLIRNYVPVVRPIVNITSR